MPMFNVRLWFVLLMASTVTGCAALTNPVKDGIEVSDVPHELLAVPKNLAAPLPLTLLGQDPPAKYRLAAGDTLGVWIEGVLNNPNQGPPIYQPPGRTVIGPTMGFPVPVREDGMVTLPLIPPLSVENMTVPEAEDAIRKAYTETYKIIQPGKERVLVTLQRRRTYHVLVYRDEAQNFNTTGAEASSLVLAPTSKRGNGHSIDLAAGENDVLNALGRTGGPPGLDVYNEVIVEHRSRPIGPNVVVGMQAVRIPLTLLPGEAPCFHPEDVILGDGDVVRLIQRDVERFYTGGLLPAGEFVLPQDYDLDVIQAISFVKGPLVNGAYGTNSSSGRLVAAGLGGPSPRLLTILRHSPDGCTTKIRVDLKRALCDSRERILIRAGDVLILQDTPCQAVARYVSDFIDKFSINLGFIKTNGGGLTTGTAVVPVPSPAP
jgi:hypothetical protein